VKIWFQNRRSKCKKLLRQHQRQEQQQQVISESGAKDDGAQCIGNEHQQLHQQVQRTRSITPPRVIAGCNSVTVKDEPETQGNSSSSSSSLSGLDTASMSGGVCGYGDPWHRQAWSHRQPAADWICWSPVDGGRRHWSRGRPANEFDAPQHSGHQFYGDRNIGGDCGGADYPAAVQPSSLWYQHCYPGTLYA